MARENLAKLVDEQVRRWEKTQGKAPQKTRPCIVLSRQPYSGATELAHDLAQRLDFGVFGREMVDEIAAQEGVKRDLVAGLDEHVEGSIERHVVDSFRRRGFTESDYLRDAVNIIATLGLRGQTIIIGRGGAQVLTSEQALRVLVVAPTEWRAERFARINQVDAKEAAERLAHEDEERAAFWKHHFQVDFVDPALHDLAVNSAALTLPTAGEIIAAAYKSRFS